MTPVTPSYAAAQGVASYESYESRPRQRRRGGAFCYESYESYESHAPYESYESDESHAPYESYESLPATAAQGGNFVLSPGAAQMLSGRRVKGRDIHIGIHT